MTMQPGLNYLHLRRITQQKSALEPGKHEQNLILLDALTKFGRNPDMVDIVLTSAVYSNMISRNHAEIVGKQNALGRFEKFTITDNSLNGTYINDRRISGSQDLREGDVIKFGHMNGAAVKAGMSAPQANAEFAFMVERALPNYNYLGFTNDGKRIRSLICKGNADILVEVANDNDNRRDESNKSRSPLSATITATTQSGPCVTLSRGAQTNTGVAGWSGSAAGFPYHPQQFPFTAFQYLTQNPHQNFMMNPEWAQQQLAAMQRMQTSNGQFLQTPNASTANALQAFGNAAGYQAPSTSASFLPSAISSSAQPNLPFMQPNNAALMSSLLQQHQLPQQGGQPGIPQQAVSSQIAQQIVKQDALSSTTPSSSIDTSRADKLTVKSPPMECDSSVPSPPKSVPTPQNNTTAQIVQKATSPKTVISEDQRSEKSWSMVDSPPPPRAPAPSHANRELSRTPSPKRDTPERIEREQKEREQREREEREAVEKKEKQEKEKKEKEEREEREREQAREREKAEKERKERQKRDSTSSGKGHKKSNELGRLFTDLDAFMSMSSRSEKRKSIDGKEEIFSKERDRDGKDNKIETDKERKQKEKERDRKEKEREKEKKIIKERPKEPVKLNKLMRQLSEPSSSSDDSDSEIEKRLAPLPPKKKEIERKKEAKKEVKKEVPKRRAPSPLSSSCNSGSDTDSNESSVSDRKSKKKKFKKEITMEKERKREKERKETGNAKEKKKRGRKPKTRQGSISSETADEPEKVIFHDPVEPCAMNRECIRPDDQNVNWVACDDCEKWYHTICILGKEEAFEEKEFFCGCKPRGKSTKKRKV